VILAGLSVFAMLAAWFLRVDTTTLWPLGATDRDDFWRRTLPWPPGVQEDDEIAWHVPRPVSPEGQSKGSRAIGSPSGGRPDPPTRPQRRIGSH
jgi:hypothetical protein